MIEECDAMEEVLIVDGYNMIGAWPELKALAETGLEEARDRLVAALADYQGFSGRKVILVFDAHQVPGAGATYRTFGLDIRYTKEKETADELIERLVGELESRRRRIYVATSDFVEQHVTFGRGGAPHFRPGTACRHGGQQPGNGKGDRGTQPQGPQYVRQQNTA